MDTTSYLYRQLEVAMGLNGLADIAGILVELCDNEVEKVAVQFQNATYAKKWAACSDACSELEKLAKDLP